MTTISALALGRYDLRAFDDHLQSCSDDERFAILRELVEGMSPFGVLNAGVL